MSGELIRNLPFSADAEQSVLGAVLIKPEIMDSFAGIISAEDFYMPEHVEIYRAMQGMYLKSRMIDLVTLIDELVKAGVYDESGGKEYIRLIAETVPSAANALDYAKIVRDKSILRSLITACDEISEAAYGEPGRRRKSRGACGKEDILRRGRSRKQKLHTYKGCASSFV